MIDIFAFDDYTLSDMPSTAAAMYNRCRIVYDYAEKHNKVFGVFETGCTVKVNHINAFELVYKATLATGSKPAFVMYWSSWNPYSGLFVGALLDNGVTAIDDEGNRVDVTALVNARNQDIRRYCKKADVLTCGNIERYDLYAFENYTAPKVNNTAVFGRPSNPVIGEMVFDVNLNKPIWYAGNSWVDAYGQLV